MGDRQLRFLDETDLLRCSRLLNSNGAIYNRIVFGTKLGIHKDDVIFFESVGTAEKCTAELLLREFQRQGGTLFQLIDVLKGSNVLRFDVIDILEDENVIEAMNRNAQREYEKNCSADRNNNPAAENDDPIYDGLSLGDDPADENETLEEAVDRSKTIGVLNNHGQINTGTVTIKNTYNIYSPDGFKVAGGQPFPDLSGSSSCTSSPRDLSPGDSPSCNGTRPKKQSTEQSRPNCSCKTNNSAERLRQRTNEKAEFKGHHQRNNSGSSSESHEELYAFPSLKRSSQTDSDSPSSSISSGDLVNLLNQLLVKEQKDNVCAKCGTFSRESRTTYTPPLTRGGSDPRPRHISEPDCSSRLSRGQLLLLCHGSLFKTCPKIVELMSDAVKAEVKRSMPQLINPVQIGVWHPVHFPFRYSGNSDVVLEISMSLQQSSVIVLMVDRRYIKAMQEVEQLLREKPLYQLPVEVGGCNVRYVYNKLRESFVHYRKKMVVFCSEEYVRRNLPDWLNQAAIVTHWPKGSEDFMRRIRPFITNQGTAQTILYKTQFSSPQ